MRPKFHRLATFNCKGLNDEVKQTHIADDFYKFRLAATMVQETRIKETGLHEFTSSDGKKDLFIKFKQWSKIDTRSRDNHNREHKRYL